MNQEIRLETKDGELIEMISLPGEGNEPDAIVKGREIYIRRPMQQTEPPKKNSPEVYFEATAHHITAKEIAPAFEKVTETKPIRITEDES